MFSLLWINNENYFHFLRLILLHFFSLIFVLQNKHCFYPHHFRRIVMRMTQVIFGEICDWDTVMRSSITATMSKYQSYTILYHTSSYTWHIIRLSFSFHFGMVDAKLLPIIIIIWSRCHQDRWIFLFFLKFSWIKYRVIAFEAINLFIACKKKKKIFLF